MTPTTRHRLRIMNIKGRNIRTGYRPIVYSRNRIRTGKKWGVRKRIMNEGVYTMFCSKELEEAFLNWAGSVPPIGKGVEG